MNLLYPLLVLLSLIAASVALLYLRLRRLEKSQARLVKMLSTVISFDRAVRKLARASARPRNRYIVFSVAYDRAPRPQDLREAIISTARRILGEAEFALAKPWLVSYNPESRCGILRVRHTYKNHMIAVLGMVRSAGEARVRIIPIATTGTIKRARKICRVRSGQRPGR